MRQTGREMVRLRFLKSEPFMYGANEAADGDDRSLPRFIRITDLNPDGTLRVDTFKSLPEDIAKPYLLQDGDLLLARSGATVGKAFLYHSGWGRACFAGYLIRLRPDTRKVFPKFLSYYTQSQSYLDEIAVSTIQATIQNVSAERYGEFVVNLPSLTEQRAIADFLDCKTALIDALIDKKQRQIELLGEKRQALISQAVTKGLDPTVPMKDSGIPWLGNIPAHWKVERLRWRLRSMGQGWSPQCEGRQADPGEWGVLKVGCMNFGAYDESENKALPPSLPPVPELVGLA